MKRLRQDQKTHRVDKAALRRVPTHSELQEELIEVVRHRAAISEVLRVIASSQDDLQAICDTVLETTTRLCRANFGVLRLYEEQGLRLVQQIGDPTTIFECWSPPGLLDQVLLTSIYSSQLGYQFQTPDLRT
jgi:hypothetical protein